MDRDAPGVPPDRQAPTRARAPGDRDARVRYYASNRAERLVDALAELVRTPLDDAFAREVVVVQGRGMGTWLSQQLAARLGVWSNSSLVFPRGLVALALRGVLGERANAMSAWSREALTWGVLRALPRLAGHEALAPLAAYVEEDATGRRAFQLAERIAEVFDQYLTYRPELCAAWDAEDDGEVAGTSNAWQPIVWRAVRERAGTPTPATLVEELGRATSRSDDAEPLPSRIAVFGLSSMPPLHARAMLLLGRFTDVHVFALSPSKEYWGDAVTPALQRRELRAGHDPAASLLGASHPLLASLGTLGRDFLDVLYGEAEHVSVAVVEPAGDLHEEAAGRSVLELLQNDLLHARRRDQVPGAGAGTAARGAQLALDFATSVEDAPPRDASARVSRIDANDRSIEVHSCHGPMREVEVLRDVLLDALSDPTTQPRDIIVMTPSVDEYAPLIEAVFDRDPTHPRYIPYRIADRAIRLESAVIDTFDRVLALVGGRTTASDVLDLAAQGAIQRRFGIEPSDIEKITEWVSAANIRWGIDAEHRARHDQPREAQNTWEFGLDRLLLGYALPGHGRTHFAGVLPYDEIEGLDAQLLGRFAELSTTLFEVLRALEAPRSLRDWCEALSLALERLLLERPDTAWQHQRVREALGALVEEALVAGFESEVDLRVVRDLLCDRIDAAHAARGFLAGGVTFCAMVPMRSIPFRVVGLLGMSDGAFPRSKRALGFDLMAGKERRRPGDRTRRDDDRHLFLEAILSARQKLVITYTGQSIRDNAKLPPSVVVSELLDAVEDGWDPPGPDSNSDEERRARVREHLVVPHPLQPFSMRYLDRSHPRLFTFSSDHVVDVEDERSARRPLFAAKLPLRQEGPSAVDVAELIRFFESPIRHLLSRRLHVQLADYSAKISNREPIQLDPLESWAVGDRSIGMVLDGVDPRAGLSILRATGQLPIGALGETAFEDVYRVARQMATLAAEARDGAAVSPLAIDAMLPSGVGVTGEIRDLYEGGLVLHQYSRVRGKHLIGLWIRHLLLAWRREDSAARTSSLIGRHETKNEALVVECGPIDRSLAVDQLEILVQICLAGRTAPMLFFPTPSLAYYEALPEARDTARCYHGDPKARRVQDPVEVAAKEFRKKFGERERDAWVARVFDESWAPGDPPPFPDDLGPPFEQLACVYRAFLSHSKEKRS